MTKQKQQIDYKISFHKKELEKYTELKEMTENAEVVYSLGRAVEKRVFVIDTDMTLEEVEDLIINYEFPQKIEITDSCSNLEDFHSRSCNCDFSLEDYGASIPEDYVMSVKNKQIRNWSRELIDLHQIIKNCECRQNNEKFEDLVDLLTEAGYNVSIENGDVQIDKE